MDPLFSIPEDFAALSTEEIEQFIAETAETLRSVAAAPTEYVTDGRSADQLLSEAREATKALQDAREALATRAAEAEENAAADAAEEAEETTAISDDELSAEMAALAAEADATEDEEEAEVEETASEEAVTAAAPAPARPKPKRRPALPKPAAARQPREQPVEETRVPLVATAGATGLEPGDEFPSMHEIAMAMDRRRKSFGIIPEGASGEKVPIARAAWGHLYPEDRRLGNDPFENQALIASATDPAKMLEEFETRQEKSLVAAGGLCAPVTPYYNLQNISVAERPVRAALAAFNADRGGIRYAAPAALTAITDAVGIITEAADHAGGSGSVKTCQVVECPDFQETDVDTIFHCLQFGNLGARTFPELLTQWSNLTLASHARVAESKLLTGIDNASTDVTAGNLGLGASATIYSQVLAAVSAMRSRHRMSYGAAPLRLMLPWWAVYLIVSDVFRGQFERFDVDQAKVVALFRSIGVEPSFYVDGANGRGQVFGTQPAGALLGFPDTVTMYLYPEGSFLYIDGGTLEIGLVRDSALNATNDFQLFGETFEAVAFVGVESLAITSTVCDSGTVSLPASVECPVDYAAAS